MSESTCRNLIFRLLFATFVYFPVSVFGQDTTRPSVNLLVFDYVGIPEGGLGRALDYVRNLFDTIDVDIRWVDSVKRARVSPPQPDTSRSSNDSLTISVAIVNKSGSVFFRSVGPHVMGFTPKSEGNGAHIYIFYDHVQFFARVSTVEAGGVGIPPVLGSTIAHEIGHVLLPGLKTHSATGIMQFRLGESELKDVIAGKLTFTPAQADLIHREINRRLYVSSVRFAPSF